MYGMPDQQWPDSPPRLRRNSVGRLLRLCLKELREILRDRRTVFTLVMMPVLLYPLLSIAFYKYLLSTSESANRIQLLIGVESMAGLAELDRYLEFADSMPDARQAGSGVAPKNPQGAVSQSPETQVTGPQAQGQAQSQAQGSPSAAPSAQGTSVNDPPGSPGKGLQPLQESPPEVTSEPTGGGLAKSLGVGALGTAGSSGAPGSSGTAGVSTPGDPRVPGTAAAPGSAATGEPAKERDPNAPRIIVVSNLKQAVAEGKVDLGVAIPPQVEPALPNGFRPIRCQLIYRKQSPLSFEALNYVEGRLQRLNDIYVNRLLTDRLVRFHLSRFGFKAELPAQLTRDEVPGRELSTFSIGTLIPLILILMTVTGAVYPAIDLTAGERERGTMETLMATPVPRMGLLAAKYVAVLTVAMLTATVNLLAMSLTLWATGMDEQAFGPAGLSWGIAGQTFALLLLFAAFFSAILVALTSFARSFKEAQAYLIPIMLLALAPGVLSLMPGLKFNGVLAITPLVNIVLLARDLFQGQVDPVLATAAVLSTSFYALAALALAAHIFGTDAILYGSHASWSDLLRPPTQRRRSATMAEAMFCLALVFPVHFVVSNVLARSQNVMAMPVRFAVYASATALVFGVLPLLLVTLQRLQAKLAFQLRAFSGGALLGAGALGLSLWPLAHEIFLLNNWLGLVTLNSTVIEAARAELTRWQGVSPVLILVALGVAPAVFEELLFRGYVFGALRNALRPATAIVCSGLLFGAFHVVTNVLAVERFLPSAFLGIVLGWVCWRSGSVFPGMLLHACHNGLLLLIAYYRDALADRGWGLAEQAHMPVTWLATAAGCIALGVGLILGTTRKRDPASKRAID